MMLSSTSVQACVGGGLEADGEVSEGRTVSLPYSYLCRFH